MIRRYSLRFAFLLVVLTASTPAAFAQPKGAAPVKVSMAKSFFNDLPPVLVKISEEMFDDTMKAATGLHGKLSCDDDAFGVAQKLTSGETQLGAFHGHEFAWVQKQHPKLVPLMVIHNKFREIKVHVIVNQKSTATKIADLAGATVDVPMGTKEHTIVYLQKHCTDNAKPNWKNFFGKVQRSNSVIDAGIAVAKGDTAAVIVDTLSLELFRANKGPVFEKYLKVLTVSEAFPPPVIAYRPGGIDNATLKTVTDGLLSADTNRGASPMLAAWQIDVFETAPKDYAHQLTNSLKFYPVPVVTKVSMR